MPPLFAFAAAAENKLVHSIHDMASRTEHSKQMAEWSAQRELHEHRKKLQKMTTQKILSQPGMRSDGNLKQSNEEHEKEIEAKFRESVLNSGVRVVSGNSLGMHHTIANFWQENPFKILGAIGVVSSRKTFHGCFFCYCVQEFALNYSSCSQQFSTSSKDEKVNNTFNCNQNLCILVCLDNLL